MKLKVRVNENKNLLLVFLLVIKNKNIHMEIMLLKGECVHLNFLVIFFDLDESWGKTAVLHVFFWTTRKVWMGHSKAFLGF